MAITESSLPRRVPEFHLGSGHLNLLFTEDMLVVRGSKTTIRVVTAKRPGHRWDARAKEDIEIARGSYRIAWGNVPVWDDYDHLGSTFNYIAYVSYPRNGSRGIVTEALSNRLVTEDPEDLKFYQLHGRPLAEVLEEKLYRSRGLVPKPIAGESRIGTIRPPHQGYNTHTIEAFAAIKLVMVRDARQLGLDFIACQLKPEMVANVFTKKGILYEFPPVEDLLEIARGAVRLNRSDSVVVNHILRYPGYFLNAEGVYLMVKQITEDSLLDLDQFRRETTLNSLEQLKYPRNIKELVTFFNTNNPFSQRLTSRLLGEVADGTYSSVSHVDDIEGRALAVLSSLT